MQPGSPDESAPLFAARAALVRAEAALRSARKAYFQCDRHDAAREATYLAAVQALAGAHLGLQRVRAAFHGDGAFFGRPDLFTIA